MVRLKSLLRWVSAPNNNTLMTAASVTRLAEAQVVLMALSRRETLQKVFTNSDLGLEPSSSSSSSSSFSLSEEGASGGDSSSARREELCSSSTTAQRRKVKTGDCVILMPTNVDLLHREICAGFTAMIPYLRSISYTTLMPQQCIRLLKSHQVFPWIPAAVIQAMANRMIAYKYMISVVALSQLIELLALIGFRNETLQDEWMGRVAEGNPMTGFNNTAPVGPMATPSDAYAVIRCAGALYQVTHSLSKKKYTEVLHHAVVKERKAYLESGATRAEVVKGSTMMLYRDMAEEIFALSHQVGPPAIYAGGILQHAVATMPAEKQPPAVTEGVSEQYGHTPTAYFEALRADLKTNGASHKVGPHLDTLAGILQLLPSHDVAIPAARFIAVYLTAVCKSHKKVREEAAATTTTKQEGCGTSGGGIHGDDWDKLMHIVKLLERPLFISQNHIAQAILECTGYYMQDMHRHHSVKLLEGEQREKAMLEATASSSHH